MAAPPRARPEPDLEPEAFRALLDRAVQLCHAHWERLPTMRAFTRPPADLVQRFEAEPLPQRERPADEVLERIAREIVPYPFGVGHPRWWGFINASAHPMGIAADLVAATLNNNCWGSSQMATHVERKVVAWLAELVRLPEGAGGILVSGGSMANLVALAAAREAIAPGTRRDGVRAHPRPLAVYASEEAHSCVRRSIELLGLGERALRLVPTDRAFRLDIAALRRQLASDRADGWEPCCIVGSAGTVNTGVVDPLEALADLARDAGCWFHVDGAYGALGAVLPELGDRYAGLERADSVAVDPHKWLYVPYECGATLMRDPAALERAFAVSAGYLAIGDDTYLEGPTRFGDLGPQLSRGFRALKVWAVLQAVGLERYRELWRNDLAVAREIVRLATRHSRLEVLAPTDLSCFCLRYLPERGDPDAFNRLLLDRIHRDGRVFITGGSLRGVFCLRGCVANYRSTLDDARIAVEAIVELGASLEAEGAGR